jgi:hypothetical protein
MDVATISNESVYVVARERERAREDTRAWAYPPLQYLTLRALRAGRVIDLDGLLLVIDGDGEEINPGDLYVGERNVGPQLLSADCIKIGAVFPTTNTYPYDLGECVRVRDRPLTQSLPSRSR